MSHLLQGGVGQSDPRTLYLTCLYVYARCTGVVSACTSAPEHTVGSRTGALLPKTMHGEEMHRDRGAPTRRGGE
jgi:hypothetical protein